MTSLVFRCAAGFLADGKTALTPTRTGEALSRVPGAEEFQGAGSTEEGDEDTGPSLQELKRQRRVAILRLIGRGVPTIACLIAAPLVYSQDPNESFLLLGIVLGYWLA